MVVRGLHLKSSTSSSLSVFNELSDSSRSESWLNESFKTFTVGGQLVDFKLLILLSQIDSRMRLGRFGMFTNWVKPHEFRLKY